MNTAKEHSEELGRNPAAWKADNGEWATTKEDAERYERRMGVKMYPLYKLLSDEKKEE